MGKIKIFGISLGTSWILFVGIFFGHLGLEIDAPTLQFIKEVALVVFIYAIGMQVGPGFFASFKQEGFTLNLLAAMIIFLGVGITYVIHIVADIPIETMTGIMAGAVTNTPSLGAAQETYHTISSTNNPDIGMGYAIAYPMAIFGIILTFGLIRFIFKINFEKEKQSIEIDKNSKLIEANVYSLQVVNPQIFGKSVKNIKSIVPDKEFIISRIQHASTGKIEMAQFDTILNENDKILIVTNEANIDIFVTMIGNKIKMSDKDWTKLNSQFVSRRFVVSQSNVNGKTVGQLKLRSLYGVNISRINRAGLEFVATPGLKIQIGDRVTVVGDVKGVKTVEKILGNSVRSLNSPNLLNIFLGIIIGVILGNISFNLPGVPYPLKLGLSGGVLISSILMSSFGARYKLITYNTSSAILMLREMGITLFLACIGLSAGKTFVSTLLGGGYMWALYGAIITIIPILLVGIIGRAYFKLNYFTLVGLIAGSMTFAPSLAFSKATKDSNISAVKYTTVFPLTMFLRVITPQLMILFFMGG